MKKKKRWRSAAFFQGGTAAEAPTFFLIFLLNGGRNVKNS